MWCHRLMMRKGELFKLSVNNPGELIPKEKLDHIFERFYEGEYRKFHTIGTGIGLSLTKDFGIVASWNDTSI